ncbi:MAG: hypothetical protein JST75_10265 [Bacteroidetes bacterium]|nr:hypothetical protein [Bacteroidota bacterium]
MIKYSKHITMNIGKLNFSEQVITATYTRKYYPMWRCVCLLLICCLIEVVPAFAQFKLSNSGAMAALNGSAITSTAPTSSINYAAVTIPPPAISITTPVKASSPIITLPPPNDKNLTFAYQSALAWWSGYFDYKTAAQSLYLSGTPLDIALAIAASAYIQSDASFVQFQNYGTKRSTMVVRANDQTPVHFPPLQIINGAAVQFNAYTPTVSSFNIEVPLKF